MVIKWRLSFTIIGDLWVVGLVSCFFESGVLIEMVVLVEVFINCCSTLVIGGNFILLLEEGRGIGGFALKGVVFWIRYITRGVDFSTLYFIQSAWPIRPIRVAITSRMTEGMIC